MGYAPLEPSNVAIVPVATTNLYEDLAGSTTAFPVVYTTVKTIQILQKLSPNSAFNWHITIQRSGGGGSVWARLLLDDIEVLGEVSGGWPPLTFDTVCTSLNFMKGSIIKLQVKANGGSGATYLDFILQGEYSPFI